MNNYIQQNLNDRIYSRNVPSADLEPYLSNRPINTKYVSLQDRDTRQKQINIQSSQQNTDHEYTNYNTEIIFNPGSGPWSGYSSHIDIESRLRDQYYKNPPPLASESQHRRLLVGESHTETEATQFITKLLPELSKSKTPIFLEFLQWELYNEPLSRYYAAQPGSKEEKTWENIIKIGLSKIDRVPNMGTKKNANVHNEDLFQLIIEAKKAGVRVHEL